jgi:hypothetical protein
VSHVETRDRRDHDPSGWLAKREDRSRPISVRRCTQSNSQGTHDVGRRIDATAEVSEVLRRYPPTGDVFLQHGPLFETEPGKLYLQYPEQTVGDYAERNSVDLQALLQRLNAEAEASEHVTAGRRPRATARRWPPEGPLGYTGSYVELKDSGIETESFVASLLARGPY